MDILALIFPRPTPPGPGEAGAEDCVRTDGPPCPPSAAPASLPTAFQYADYTTIPVGVTHAEWRRR